jgi:hypothetical protein
VEVEVENLLNDLSLVRLPPASPLRSSHTPQYFAANRTPPPPALYPCIQLVSPLAPLFHPIIPSSPTPALALPLNWSQGEDWRGRWVGREIQEEVVKEAKMSASANH